MARGFNELYDDALYDIWAATPPAHRLRVCGCVCFNQGAKAKANEQVRWP